ncbi:MAG TPA: DUF4145 domain-containing protein [Xanthobacteraceae bacterium]|jgi:hypothetical protein|nr:DUF4145 domain-containing protein [Xanthobacteraceae bacterium]
MTGKIVPPELGANSFSCPHCGAQAHQMWYRLLPKGYDKDAKPWMPDADAPARIRAVPAASAEMKAMHEQMARRLERIMTREIFVEEIGWTNSQTEVANLKMSLCYSCGAYAVWHADTLLYPAHHFAVEPNEDMPADVKLDFAEAASIVDSSARGAAALLRLCIQKLMPHLGEKGENLNGDIKSLVAKGLDPRIQQALDVVRVIGNNAVHPGQIDLKDDKATAIKLFELVNTIVTATISAPKSIAQMYETILPEAARAAIAKRDGIELPAPEKARETEGLEKSKDEP